MTDHPAMPLFALPRSPLRRAGLLLLAFFFVGAGVAHFVRPAFFVAIVPPYLPAPLGLVYLSGVFEILGGVGVLVAPVRRWAGYGLMGLLAAVFLANIHMALNPSAFPGVPAWGLYARLPLQFVFIAWVWWATALGRGSDSTSA